MTDDDLRALAEKADMLDWPDWRAYRDAGLAAVPRLLSEKAGLEKAYALLQETCDIMAAERDPLKLRVRELEAEVARLKVVEEGLRAELRLARVEDV